MGFFFRLLILLLSLSGSHSSMGQSLPAEPHIVVSGNSSIEVTPDTLHLSLSMIETGKDVDVVARQVETRAAGLIRELKALGIQPRDINSSQLRIQPHFNWRNQQQVYVGTEVSRTVDITLRELGRYDRLIRLLLDSKVGRINHSRLESSRASQLRKQAMQQAVEDARVKAELLVSKLPEKLGAVYSISYHSAQPGLPRQQSYQAREMASADTAFEPGEIEFNESVTVIFYLAR